MKWSRILMANGMRYDISHDISPSINVAEKGIRFMRLKLEDGRNVILNTAHIVSVEIDGEEK